MPGMLPISGEVPEYMYKGKTMKSASNTKIKVYNTLFDESYLIVRLVPMVFLHFHRTGAFGNHDLQVLHVAVKYQVNMAHVALFIDDKAHVVAFLNDRIDRPSSSQPPALLTARIVAEEFDDIFMLEITGLETEQALNVSTYKCFVQGIETIFGHRHTSRFIDRDPFDVAILDLGIFR